MIVLPVGDDTRSRPLAPTVDVVDLTEPSGETDEDLVRCLRHASFSDDSSKLICFADFDSGSWKALTLSEGLSTKRAVEATHASKIVKLELVDVAQAKRIAELEEACANLKPKKENVTTGYRRLAEKYKRLEEKATALNVKKLTQWRHTQLNLLKLRKNWRRRCKTTQTIIGMFDTAFTSFMKC
jgi:hypothetical protein